MVSTHAAFLSEAILQFLRDYNVDVANLYGQGYNEAGGIAEVSVQIMQTAEGSVLPLLSTTSIASFCNRFQKLEICLISH